MFREVCEPMDQRIGIAAILAIISAIASVFVDSAFFGFLLAIAAVVLGIIGFVMAASPRVRGGILSLTSIGIAVLALVVNVLKAVFNVFG